MRTREDIITTALRRIGVTAHDDDPTADQALIAGEALDSIYDEVNAEAAISWTLAAGVPEISANSLINLLGVEVAQTFSLPQSQSRGRAFGRLLATIRPDDRPADEAESMDYM